jgi:receptor-type tyrosine-protein phosphatase gamma
MSWAPPFNSDKIAVTHYIIQIRAGEETPWTDSTIVETPDNVTLYQVTGLLPFTTYSFRVTAVNPVGKSKASKGSFYMFTLREGSYY